MRGKWLSIVAVLALATAAASQTTALTYQGRLKNGGEPASGLHDFRFRLFDALVGGSQLGTTQCVDNLSVADGLFATPIDFGQQFASPDQRFLEIQVRKDAGLGCGNGAGFVTLPPRQPLTAAPLASHANSAFALDAADGGPADAVFVDAEGEVGFGTTAPASKLHAFGEVASVRVQDDSDPASFFLLEDTQPTQARMLKFTNAGTSLIDINPLPLDGVGNAHVRFFRLTDTTGIKSAIFHRGNNTTATSAVIGVDGSSSVFQLDGGNFGIGTTEPLAKLDVRGDISLGDGGQYRATASEENLRIVRGSINNDGSVLVGSGFTCELLEKTGHYRITFTPPFTDVPVITATTFGPNHVLTVAMIDGWPTAGGVIISTCRDDTEWSWHAFNFIAIGPR